MTERLNGEDDESNESRNQGLKGGLLKETFDSFHVEVEKVIGG